VTEKNHDDFAGLDLKGKVAVTILGLPDGISGPLAAHYQADSERWKQFRNAGLIGCIVMIPSRTDNWSSMAASRTQPSLHLADDEKNETRDCGL
jgi:hypothetical protein